MSKSATIPIELATAQAEALAAVAAGSGGTAAKLAAWIIGEWVGRLPVKQTPPPMLAKAHQRLAILQVFWKARESNGALKAFTIAAGFAQKKGFSVCRTSLYGWERRWSVSGLEGLVDHRNSPSKPIQSPFIDRVKEIHRSGRGRRVSTCYRQAQEEFKGTGKIPSYRTAARSLGRNRRSA